MFRGLGSDFEMIEGEKILRVRDKTLAKRWKIKIWNVKEEKGRKREHKEK